MEVAIDDGVLSYSTSDTAATLIIESNASVWIATANLKDVHVQAKIGTRASAKSRFVSLFAELIERANSGLDVRLLCSGVPSRGMQSQLQSGGGALIRRCPRLHAKMITVDGELLYLGSANFTGAGIGAKSEHRRNFETGIVSDCPLLIDELQSYFDAIWTGKHCKSCLLRAHCPTPIDTLGENAGVSVRLDLPRSTLKLSDARPTSAAKRKPRLSRKMKP